MSSFTCKTVSCKVKRDLETTGYCKKCTKARKKAASDTVDVEYPCGECEQACTKSHKALECDICFKWFHISCIEVDDQEYEFLQRRNEVKWVCNGGCDLKFQQTTEKANSLEAIIKVLQSELNSVKTRLDTAERKLDGSVTKEIDAALSEKADIERRKVNLIVYNLPEPIQTENHENAAWDNKAKIEADIISVKNIIEKEMKVNMADGKRIKDARRLGLKDANGKKSRPLRVEFEDIDVKRQVLSNAKSLRTSNDAVMQNVFFNPDLTFKQREFDNKLRDLMWERREKGENVIIKRGKIIEADFIVPKVRRKKNNERKTVTDPKNQKTDGVSGSSSM